MKNLNWNIKFLSVFFVLLCYNSLFSQFTITENFKGNNLGGSIISGGDAYLTSGIDDPVNNGWLRLTKDLNYQKGYAYVNNSFPADLGIFIEFEYKTWRSKTDSYNGGDGFSVFLFNGATQPFSIGAYGGSLGYAQLVSGSTNLPGLSGAYLGIGFDEYGNFANASEGKNGGTSGLSPNSIVLRGAQNPPTPSLPYRYLTHKQLQTNSASNTNSIDWNTVTATRPTDATFYRRIKISIEPIGTIAVPKYKIRVLWRITPTGPDVEQINYDSTDPIPATLKMGFAASTGGAINFHEIRNLMITTLGGVRVQKEVDKDTALPNENLTYTVNVYNDTMTPVTNLGVTDIIKNGLGNTISNSDFQVTSILFNNNGVTGNTASGFTSGVPKTTGITNPFSSTLNLDSKSFATFTIVGNVKTVPPGGTVNNNVSLDVSNINIIDADTTNNTATVTTTILNPAVDLKIEKGVDNNGKANASGNVFTLLVSNLSSINKPASKLVTVTDIIPAGLSVTSVTATGWTVANTGNNYTFTRNDALASGFAYPPITINVMPSLNGPWINTTNLTYPDDTNTTNNTSSATLRQLVCYNNATTGGVNNDTKVGITLLKRAGNQNTDNWPLVRKSGHIALESNTQGFVITRMTTAQLNAIKTANNAVEGMISYDTDVNCVKIFSGGDWKCFNMPNCP